MEAAVVGHRLTRLMRLQKYDVVQILAVGRSIRSGATTPNNSLQKAPHLISIRFLTRGPARNQEPLAARDVERARIAISAPKKFLKSAVSRNRFKRWVREAFRYHEIRGSSADLLISLIGNPEVAKTPTGRRTQEAIESALSQLSEQLFAQKCP